MTQIQHRTASDRAAQTTPERVVEVVQDRLVDAAQEVKPRLRGWLHAGTAPLAFISLLVVLVIAETPSTRIGVAVFMVSALLLFTTSAVYHTGTWTPRLMQVLKRLDHANIFILIAGSTTAFAILLLPPDNAVILLTIMWGGAAAGVVFKIFWITAPRWLNVPLYLVLGSAPILFTDDFVGAGHHAALMFLAAGGLLYSLGALVYATKRPNPSPAYFGFHEVFHTLTIAAFATHYVGISLLAYSQR
jgi:hemolysin III